MANELKHDDVGGELSRAEWEAIGTHVLDSQATGDMIIATSATQLSRLSIGIANQVPHVAGGTLVYASTLAGLTLTTPNINGVIGTTGLTMPAFTLGGAIAGGGQEISNLSYLEFGVARGIKVAANNSYLFLFGGTGVAGSDAHIVLRGKDQASTGYMNFYTPNAAGNADVERLNISGKIGTAVATWANVTHTGLVLSDDLTFSTSVDSALVANEVSLSGFDIGAARSLAISQENPVVVEAIGASDRTLPVRINGANYKIMLHT